MTLIANVGINLSDCFRLNSCRQIGSILHYNFSSGQGSNLKPEEAYWKMRNRLILILIIGLALVSTRTFGAEHSKLHVFPEAGEGMVRLVIVLPDKERGEETYGSCWL